MGSIVSRFLNGLVVGIWDFRNLSCRYKLSITYDQDSDCPFQDCFFTLINHIVPGQASMCLLLFSIFNFFSDLADFKGGWNLCQLQGQRRIHLGSVKATFINAENRGKILFSVLKLHGRHVSPEKIRWTKLILDIEKKIRHSGL